MKSREVKMTIRKVMASIYHASNHFLKHLQRKTLILTYHRVLSEKELRQDYIQPGMYVRDDVFEKQIQFLKEYFKILSFAELLNLWSEKNYNQSQRYCVITFDDGWLDNYVYAYPILRKYNIPATVFLPTSFIGTNQWFWPEKVGYLLRHYYIAGIGEAQRKWIDSLWVRYPWAKVLNGVGSSEKIDSVIEMCKELPEDHVHDVMLEIGSAMGLRFPEQRIVLNWEEIEEMSQNGVSFGSHSCTHRILTKLPAQEVQREIMDSLYTLREKKVNDIPVFCYPNGNYTQEIMKWVKAAGYRAAVSTDFGFEGRFPEDLFSLRRIGIHHDICATIPLFTLHISGLNNLSRFML